MMMALDMVVGKDNCFSDFKIGWIAPTIETRQQAELARMEFKSLANLDFKFACAAAQTDWSDRDFLITDEAHHCAKAVTWFTQVQSCNGSRWACTATPFGDDHERNSFLLKLFDNHILEIGRHEVAARLVPAVVRLLDATDAGLQKAMDYEIEMTMQRRRHWFKGEEWELRAQATWHVCIKRGIVGNQARNAKVVELAKKHAADSVLVLVNEIEHGKELAERIPLAELCYSKMGKTKRADILGAFKAGSVKCIVATSLADEGADFPRANVLIMVSGGRSEAKTIQRTGRVLRAFPGKTHGLIYDFRDRQHPMMERHANKRIATYRRLGYRIEL